MSQAPITRWTTHWATVKPLDTALIFEERRYSWRELADTMTGWAGRLAAVGVRKGDRVACLLSNRPEFYFTFLAVARLGAVFVPVNGRLAAAEAQHVITDSGAGVLVTESAHGKVATALQAATDLTLLDVDALPDKAGSDASDLPEPVFEDIVAILYTSGTTGRPKGATFTHANVFFAAESMCRAYDYGQSDLHLVNAPLYFTGGLLTLSQPVLLSGGTLVLQHTFDPELVLRDLERHRITVWLGVPAALGLLRQHKGFRREAFASVRVLGSGSAPLPLSLIEFYEGIGVPLCQGYALTEGGGVATILDPADARRKAGTAGLPMMFTDIAIVTETGEPAQTGQAGEILQRGPSVSAGYWGNPEATVALHEGPWIRTGDIGSLDEDGYLSVLGRLKDLVITGGMNVYPAEVESVLTRHPQVADAAVVGVPHQIYGETVTAFVVPVNGCEPTLDEIRAFCGDHLADYKLPRLLRLVPELPRTGSGKVRKNVLRDALSAELERRVP